MNAETFYEQFETFAEAPNGVATLRGMILQLAVQGKLVPQDPNDEPASRLLHRARIAMEVLAIENDYRNEMLAHNDSKAGVASSSNSGWIVARIGDFAFVKGGKRLPQGATFSSVPTNHAYIRVTSMKSGTIIDEGMQFIDSCVYQHISRYVIESSDLYITIAGTIGQVGEVPARYDKMNLTENAAKIVFREIDKRYLLVALNSEFVQLQFHESTNQQAQPKLALKRIADTLVPIPPLEEQRRIVEKVGQLLGLCDELTARQAAKREVRTALVGATLDRVVSVRTAAEFPAQAKRLRNNFDFLFDTPTTIPQLRRAILQLAVQGQLVPQDPNDEPAGELLARVDSEKRRLEELGEFKTQPSTSPLADWEVLFPIPPSWKWVRAAELSYPISSGSTPAKSVFQSSPEGGVPYLKVYNIRGQKIDFDYCPQYINQMHHASKMKRSILVPGMVILNIVGPPLGKTAVIPSTFPEWNCNQAIAFFRFIGDVLPEFVHTYFKAGAFLKNIALIGTAGQDNISVTKCKNIVIPLPPLAEQKRIVSKVTELLSLCDALEAKLTQAESASTQLLSAAIHDLLTKATCTP